MLKLITFIVLFVFTTLQYLMGGGVCCVYGEKGPDVGKEIDQTGRSWPNYHEVSTSNSLHTNEPISGNDSLRLVLLQEEFEDSVKIANDTVGTTIDPTLQIESVFKGIDFPTSMAFLDKDDILVLEKNHGTVKRIVNGNMLDEPLLDVNVANRLERGMLGIAISRQDNNNGTAPKIFVFLYFTETRSRDGQDLEPGGVALANRLYRYELVNGKLLNPKLLLNLPAEPGPQGGEHQGGVVLIGPDNNVYLVVGDVNRYSEAQNMVDGYEPDGTSAILRITQEGNAVQDAKTMGEKDPLNKYYAYGIRNSFGIGFDPLTNNLWDTENGLNCCDEINLVEPGFNSGWAKIQGFWLLNQTDDRNSQLRIFNYSLEKEMLFDFGGKGNYSSPEFIWGYTVAPTAIGFLNSSKLGDKYENDIFVGNVNDQTLYNFDLDQNRTALMLNGTLADRISDSRKDLEKIIFAKELGRITDMEVGPDGNLYIVSHKWYNDNQSKGRILKISKDADLTKNLTIGKVGWENYNDDSLAISIEKSEPISGNASLRVDVLPATGANEFINSSWSIISTDFIPVDENQYYNYSLEISAKDVNQVHSKVIYYDPNKKEINADFIFGGRDGTFNNEKFDNSFLSRDSAKYVKIQMWVRQSLEKNAMYLVDNVELTRAKF